MSLSAIGTNLSTSDLTILNLLTALITHQLFRRYEPRRILTHVSLLLSPPAFVAAYLSSKPDPTYTLPNALLVSLITHLSVLLFSIVFYRLSPLHPLARYPGPFWRRVTMFGPAWLSVTGDRSRHIHQLHKRYGDVVRIGPNELSINDPTFIAPLLGVFGVPKGPELTGPALSRQGVPMVGIQDTEEHLRRRRAWNRGLSSAALKEYEPAVAATVQQLIRRLEEQFGEVIIGDWLNYFAYDVMSEMAFGGGPQLLRHGDNSNVWDVIQDGMVYAGFLSHVPWLGIYVGKIPGAAQSLNTLISRGKEFAAKRLAEGSQARDLFHYLNNEDLPDKPPPPPHQLVDDGVLAVVAGSDTTSIGLTSLLWGILANPNAYNALQAEVDQFYPSGESALNTKHYKSMHYLQAVINEALRLFPPVPGGGQRQVPHDGRSVIVGSLYLPPGTCFFIPPWSLHRDPRNFVFPDAFWPERWLIASGQLSLENARLPDQSQLDGSKDSTFTFVHNDSAFVPFSHGPMNCPGKGLALLEMRMVACALLQRFTLRLSDGWDPRVYERGVKDYFTATRPALPVILAVRGEILKEGEVARG